MTKKKKGTKDNPIVISSDTLEKLQTAVEGAFGIDILEAQIKDDFCFYFYEITGGKFSGFGHKVTKAPGIIEDDMRNAFAKLNVHLAVIDDVFKNSDIQIGNIEAMHNEDLSLLYNVTGFKVKGGEENESVVLIGNKKLSCGSRMELESPKIPLDSLSSYMWYNELKEAVDLCRSEIKLYHEGKFTPVKVEEPEEDTTVRQMTIAESTNGTEEEDFENAKV